MMSLYTLDKLGRPRKERNLLKWSKWMEQHNLNRRVAMDYVGDAAISTVFLGIDHSGGFGKKQLYETLILGAEGARRYATRKEAEEGHKEIVAILKLDLEVKKSLGGL